jgi:abequosyltransferase
MWSVRRPLTIAIPTYNRASHLERQLEWLAGIGPHALEQIDVVVSDNCSTDETPEVVERWRSSFPFFRSRRNERNVGAIRNIAWCLAGAETPHVWAIGDDDTISDTAVDYVLAELELRPDLAMLTLNFSSRLVQTGEVRFDRCYDFADDLVHESGRLLFLRCLEADLGGVALTTAQVYRTELVRIAIREWNWGLRNLVTQIYWTGYCAANGPYKVTRDAHLECAAGTHFFLSDSRLVFKLECGDTPELLARLAKIGYARGACLRLLRRQLRGRRREIVRSSVRWPAVGAGVLARLGKSLAVLRLPALGRGARGQAALDPEP